MTNRSDLLKMIGNKIKLIKVKKKEEITLWVSIATLVGISSIITSDSHIELFKHPLDSLFIMIREASVSIAIVAAVIIFYMSFGEFPLSIIVKQAIVRSSNDEASIDIAKLIENNYKENLNYETYNPRILMALLSKRSEALAERIYLRSSIHLLCGISAAILGVAFFYVRMSYRENIEPNYWKYLIIELFKNAVGEKAIQIDYTNTYFIIGNVGILVFLETIAFFFLRQYRTAMDEFRYFNSIQRTREENLIALCMYAENKSITPTSDVLKSIRLYSDSGSIKKDETTELLELRKIQKEDSQAIDALIDAIVSSKKK